MNIKKLLILTIALMTLNAYACEIQTIIIDGQVFNCTICGNVTTCN